MCAITGSFSQNKLADLYRLNAYRGELSYSLSSFSFDDNKVRLDTMMQDRDRMPENLIAGLAQGDNKYYIAHSQAPTTNATTFTTVKIATKMGCSRDLQDSLEEEQYDWLEGLSK